MTAILIERTDTIAESIETAKAADLHYVSDARPGIRRRHAAGKKFKYFDAHGHVVTDAQTLARIRSLAIPPAWNDVWICPSPHGHIQAVGRDARGRKQYRYHPRVARRGTRRNTSTWWASLARCR